jgi:FMN phosphatase YigB (HAD superfamily)
MNPPTPRFIYFDMGNVLVHFDEARAARQMGEVAGIDAQQARRIVFESDLQHRFERGEVSEPQFHEAFCEASGTQPDPSRLLHAGADMFELNVPIVPLVVHLHGAGHKMGILSNTCSSHWTHVRRRFRVVRSYFDTTVLSFEVGAMKPSPRIYECAAEAAKVPPQAIFYLDDRQENVDAAVAAGFDAVLYTDVPALAAALRWRGVDFNF